MSAVDPLAQSKSNLKSTGKRPTALEAKSTGKSTLTTAGKSLVSSDSAAKLDTTSKPGNPPQPKPKAKQKAKAKPKTEAVEVSLEDDLAAMEAELAKKEEEEAIKAAEEAEEARLAAEAAGVEMKEWVMFVEEGTGELNKLQIYVSKISVDEIRKAISKMSGCKTRSVCFKIHGHEWTEGKENPLKPTIYYEDFDVDTDKIYWWRSDRMKLLLEKRGLATINNLDRFERGVLHFAVMDGDHELTEEAINHMNFKISLVKKPDIYGDTALHYCSILGYEDIAELLLDRQADPQAMNINQRTPTMLATEHGHAAVTRALLRMNATLASNQGKGCWKYPNPMWYAKLNNRQKVLREIDNKKKEDAALEAMGMDI